MARSILSNWVGLLALAASTALLTPIMIRHLGALDYGVWVLAGSVLDYYGLLDIGMRSAMFRYVGLFRGCAVREEVDRTLSSALFIVIISGAIICTLSVGVAYFLPRAMTLRDASPHVFSCLLLLLGMSVGITFPTRLLATYISAHQRWDLFNAAGIASIIARAVGIVAVLKLGYGLLAIAIVTLVVALLSLGQHIAFVRIADPRAHVSLTLVSGKRIGELFGFSMRSLLVSVGDYLRFYSDSAVIAAVLNLALVTPFSVATRLIECFKSVVVAAGGPVLGTMTELDGAQRQEEMRQLLLKSTRLLALLSVLGGVLLLVDGRALLNVWVGGELATAYAPLAILTAGYMINLAFHPMLLIVIAKGKHGPLGAWTIAEGISNIGLSILWGKTYGLLGIAMGTVVPMLIIKLTLQPYYALKAAQICVRTYIYAGLARPLLISILFFVVAERINVYIPPTVPFFFVMVLVQVMAFLAMVALLGCTREERRWLWRRMRNVGLMLLPRPTPPAIATQKPLLNEKD